MSNSSNSKNRSSEYVPIPNSRIVSGILLTFGFCGFPLFIYMRKPFFRRFCDFHTQKFRLAEKSPYQIAGLSLGLSIVYSSIYCPIYYFLMMKILGISGIFDLADQIKKSSRQTTLKYPYMRKFDQKIVNELDKFFKIEDQPAREFLIKTLGKDYLLDENKKSHVESK